MTTPRWRPEHVGLIRYSSYWHKYCLILAVDEKTQRVTELDAFAGINQHPGRGAQIRTHYTGIDKSDKFLTVAEYYSQVIDSK